MHLNYEGQIKARMSNQWPNPAIQLPVKKTYDNRVEYFYQMPTIEESDINIETTKTKLVIEVNGYTSDNFSIPKGAKIQKTFTKGLGFTVTVLS